MAKLEIPFIGGAYTARSKALNAQVCQNLYMEIDQTGAKNLIALVGTPGLALWKDTGGDDEIRAFSIMGDNLYAVSGNTLYSITSSKTVTSVGTIGTSSGWCDITNDGITMMVVDSTGGWTTTGSSLTSITDSGFPTPSSATYQDGYHIVTRADTDQFFISTSDDPTDWDATDFATAEGDGDKLVVARSVVRQLWLLGERSTEVYYNSGESFPFTRNPGGFLGVGCGAKRSVADFEGTLLWLDDKYRVVQSAGIGFKPVSTYQIDYLISTMTSKTDAVGFMYFQEGHVFYVLSFPTDNKTICYDLTTGFWHTRASGQYDKRERANCSIVFGEKVLVGDFENGKIYEYSLSAYDDAGTIKRAIRAGQAVHKDRNNVFFDSFELDFEAGVGLATGQGSDPQAMLQWSNDGGKTWSDEYWESIGKAGDYDARIKWYMLGASRNRVFRVTISDPVRKVIVNAYLEGTVGIA